MSQPKFPAVDVRAFFERFQSASAASDVDGLAAMYGVNVMIAGPNGAQVVSSAQLLQVIPKRQQLLASIGHVDTTLVGFDETRLTDRYSLVRAQFQWRFKPAATGPVSLPSTYIVDRGGDELKIVLYMNEQDVVSVLRDRGVLPPVS